MNAYKIWQANKLKHHRPWKKTPTRQVIPWENIRDQTFIIMGNPKKGGHKQEK